MMLKWQMISILLTNSLSLVHIRYRWYNERLRTMKLKFIHVVLTGLISLLIYSNWTWMFSLCKFTLTWILLRHNEIVHLLVSEINLHILICINQSLLMLHICQILDIRIEELMVINDMRIIMHASWQTLTVIESELMIPLWHWWVFFFICQVLTVKWAQFTCCIVCDFRNLV